jgi:DNA topoisomerase-3
MWKVIASRRIENEEADELFRTRAIGPLQGFRSRMGRPFAAMVKIKDDFAVELDFGQSANDEQGGGEPVDFSDRTPLGDCPKCGAHVYDHEIAYVCEKSVGPEKSCDFRMSKIILQRQIEPEQVARLLATGKTDLLQRFISKKGRPFAAFLVRQPGGKIGFEFAPRAERKPAAKKAAEPAESEVIPAATKGATAKAAANAATARAPARGSAAAATKAATKTAGRAAAAAKPAARKTTTRTATVKKRA